MSPRSAIAGETSPPPYELRRATFVTSGAGSPLTGMNRRRILSGATLAATLALPATAGAQDTTEKNCLKFDSKDERALEYAFKGDTLTLTPRSDDELLRVKTSKKRAVKVTRKEDTYTFDLPEVEGETFEATERKSAAGKLKLRVSVLDADGDRLTRFDVKVKAFDEVACEQDEDEKSDDDDEKSDDDKKKSDDDKEKSDDDKEKSDDDGSRGRGRGPESEEIRKSRVERGEGRGPETDAEREDRKDDDR